MKLRGPGEIYGALQHGALDLRIATLSDTKLIHRAQADVQKFLQHPHLIEMLLQTGDEELVEGNKWGDRFWGVCKGKGENHLGKISITRMSYTGC